MHEGAVAWSVKNGAAIGVGAFTRLGFSLWYVIPLAALLVADVRFGALVYGLYAFVRTGSVWLIWGLGTRRVGDFQPLLTWLTLHRGLAQVVATTALATLSAGVLLVVGL